MKQSRAERVRGALRWFPITALCLVAPKCLLCLAAYTGVGAALGAKLVVPEFCGGSTPSHDNTIAWLVLFAAVVALVWVRRSISPENSTAGEHVLIRANEITHEPDGP
jgi:hypothetical protein